jgi:hypothetical protein
MNRKRLSVLLAMALLFSLAALTATAADSPSVTVGIVDASTGKAGDEIMVSVTLSNNPGVAGFTYALNFENTKLLPVEVSPGTVGAGGLFSSNLQSGGDPEDFESVEAALVGTSNFTDDGVLFSVKFRIKEGAAGGNTELALSGKVTNQSLAVIDVEVTNATITIQKSPQNAPSPPTLAGRTADSVTLNAIEGAQYRRDQSDAWQASPVFTGLSPDTEYSFYARLAETASHDASPESAQSETFRTLKLPQTAPQAPTAANKTAVSVTLDEIEGAEYSMDGSTWQDDESFADLTPNTAYAFYARLKEDDAHEASPPSEALNVATDKAMLTGTVTIAGDAVFGETLTAQTDSLASEPSVDLGALSYLWKRGAEEIDGANDETYTVAEADIGETLSVTVATANCAGDISSSATGTVSKASQTAPAAPTLASKTSESITLEAIAGAEYRRDQSDAWQASPVFTGLSPNTEYSFYARLAETESHNASPESAQSETFRTSAGSGGGSNSGGSGGGGISVPTNTTPNANANANAETNVSEKTISTPVGKDPVENNDGTVTLPGGGTIVHDNGIAVEVPSGAIIDDGGRVTIPKGNGGTLKTPGDVRIEFPGGTVIGDSGRILLPIDSGATVKFSDGNTLEVSGGYVIEIANPDTPLASALNIYWNNPFSDIDKSAWYYGDVEYVYANGLFTGTSSATFGPALPMTRGMIVTVLGRLHDVDASAYGTTGFDDVAPGQYYAAYIEWAKEKGIVNGTGTGKFAPETEISRQDLATIIMRYAEFANKEFPVTLQYVTFADEIQIADYAKNAVQALYGGGIVTGKPGNVFDSRGNATRAEVAAVLHRFSEKTEE